MDDLPCPKRLEAKGLDGKVRFYICNHPNAAMYKLRVRRAVCDACPLRVGDEEPTFKAEIMPDGRIVYERKPGDWEPPRPHKGYRRDPDDPWVFIPDWPPCPHRELNETRKTGCGCLLVEMTCKDSRSPFCGEQVELETCLNCSLIATTGTRSQDTKDVG